ncbi:MAG: TonB-dependent receptor plug domain-containing protein [Novosphingobium sp.]
MRKLTTLSFLLAASPAFAQAVPAGGSSAIDQVVQTAEDNQDPVAAGDIVVVATRLPGQVDAAQAPIATFDEKDIQALGATSVSDLISRVSPQTGSGRGRGSGGMPVILVNGMRITNFREMRNYPPEAIRRVEILPEEVALRYGFPPNSRVVNLILKENFSSRSLQASYSLPTRGGFNSWQTEATFLKIRKLNRFTVTGTASDTSPLFENERKIIQAVTPAPGSPDPAAYRSLIADSRNFGLNLAWTKGLGKDGTGGSLTLSGEAAQADSHSYSGLNTFSPTVPDPLDRISHTTTVNAGAGYNTSLDRWQFSATVDGSHAENRTIFDRNGSTGTDRTTSNTDSVTSLATMIGRPVRLPGGDVATTFKAGYAWSGIDSTDTRSTIGPVSLRRGDVSAGANLAVPITNRRENFGRALGDITLNFSAGYNHLSDFGDLTDWSAGLTWAPTEKLNLGASYIVNQAAPSLSQLGSPQTLTLNVPVYDFSRGESVLVTITGGGNADLKREQQRDIKLSANWQLPFMANSNLVVEWFRNRSTDVTAAFPLLTPEIEAAFGGRVTRVAGQLVAIDQRAVTFARQESSRLRWGLNLSGAIGKAAPDAGGMFPGMGGGTRGPRGSGAAAGAGAPSVSPQGAGRPRGGGGRGGGMMGMLGGGNGQGRWSLGLYHTVQFMNRVLVAPGGPTLDLLNGDSLSTSGTPRHSLEFNGGAFYRGFGSFFQGTWNAPTTVGASGLPGTSDLRFGSVTSVNLFLFADLAQMPKLTKRAPFLKGSRLSLRFENLLDSHQKVTDGSDAVPLSYQPDYLDPRGRVISLEFRKMF